MTRSHSTSSSSSATSARSWLIGALALIVAIGAASVVASVVDSAEARFAGSTANRGSLLGAGEVELTLVGDEDRADGSATLAEFVLDASNVLPGETIQRCIVVAYRGTVDEVDLHLYGRLDGGEGLERYIDATFDVGSGSDPGCSDFNLPALDPVSWSGRLSTFAATNGDYAQGLPVLENAPGEATATVRVDLELVGGNEAQGLSTGFWLVLEVRP